MHKKKLIKRSGGALLLPFFACLGMIQVVHAAANSSSEFAAGAELTLRNSSSFQTIADISTPSISTHAHEGRSGISYSAAVNLKQIDSAIYAPSAAGLPLVSPHNKFLQLTTTFLLKDKTTVNDRLQGDICV